MIRDTQICRFILLTGTQFTRRSRNTYFQSCTMASLELDPIFLKALKYLHSKSKDSADKLRKLLDDAIAQRTGQKTDKSETKVSKSQKSDDHKREGEKRSHDKIKSEQDTDAVPAKKAKKDNAHSPKSKESLNETASVLVKESGSKSHSPNVANEDFKDKIWGGDNDRSKKDESEKRPEKKEAQEKTTDSTDEEKSFDADDFAFGLGIACGACNRIDVSSGNQLVECQECHTLYHQECHKPPVTEQDVNDPRFVWYCYKCKKSMKKMQVKSSGKSKVSSSSSSKDSSSVATAHAVTSIASPTTPTASKSAKSEKMDPTSLFSFRRVENKANLKDNVCSSGNKPLSGFESLAANLSGKGDSSRGSKSESGKTDGTKSSHAKADSSKTASARSDSSSSKSQKEKTDSSDKTSKSSKSSDIVKTTGGGIKLGIDLFKGPPKSDLSKARSSDASRSSGKSSELQKSKSVSDSNKLKSDSVKVIKSASELVKLNSRSHSTTESSKGSGKGDSSKTKIGSSSSGSAAGGSGSGSSSGNGSSGSSGSSSSKNPQGGTVSAANADKRLQMMKKKAAAKLQDRRSSFK